MEQPTIEKVSDTEYKLIETVPEQVKETVVSLAEKKSERDTKQALYDRLGSELVIINAEIARGEAVCVSNP